MPAVDALFLHAPRFAGHRREVMVMPLGLPALANVLADDGRSVEIVHLGIEPEVDPSFSLGAAIRAAEPRMVLIPLHFHPQTRAAIDAARVARHAAPKATIVMGGLTATVFAQDLVSVGFADAVVRGDGEEPLRALARVVMDGEGTFRAVPNLTYHDGDHVEESAASWAIDEQAAARLRHADLRLLRHAPAYVKRTLYADFSEGSTRDDGYPDAVYLNAGRGCTAECVACGGAASSQLGLAHRSGLVLYPVDKLGRDVADAVGMGARVLRSCFDPPAARSHVTRWLGRMRADGVKLRAIYDLWSPAPRAFLGELATSFDAGSMVVFSPDAGREEVRARLRGYPLSNQQLLRSIREAEDAGLEAHCFFGAGHPTETASDVDETARLIERIRRETRSGVSVTPMFLDPGSPLWRDPGRFGARLVRRTLRDYYEEVGLPEGPGYETEHFTEAETLDACRRLRQIAGLDG